MTEQHSPSCRWPIGAPCRRFSTDGTRLGAAIAHQMGTDDEEEIKRQAASDLKREIDQSLTGMEAEQADWDGDADNSDSCNA